MDFPLRKPAPLDTSASKDDKKPKDIVYTHRQELEVMAERGVQTAINRLQPINPPAQYRYVWHHFWLILEFCSNDFTIHDLREYQNVFAPSMTVPDKLILLRMRTVANNYIDELKESQG